MKAIARSVSRARPVQVGRRVADAEEPLAGERRLSAGGAWPRSGRPQPLTEVLGVEGAEIDDVEIHAVIVATAVAERSPVMLGRGRFREARRSEPA
jgi:hypothetical protein